MLLAKDLHYSDTGEVKNCCSDDIHEDGCQFKDINHDLSEYCQLAGVFSDKDEATSDCKFSNRQIEVRCD